MQQPIKVVRLLMAHGLSLRKAHDLIDRLALGEEVVTELSADSPARALVEFADAGVAATVIRVPDVDLHQVRQRLKISQAEFAARFGFALDSVRNWEQGRYQPDDATRTLLSVIHRHAEAVDDVLRRPTHLVLKSMNMSQLGGFVAVSVVAEVTAAKLLAQVAAPHSGAKPFVMVAAKSQPQVTMGRKAAPPTTLGSPLVQEVA